jgi:RNA polymerase sigma-70 factor, ECF subfamily
MIDSLRQEKQAIAALKRGEVAALEVLVRRYQLRAIRAAYLVVRDRAAAEDIVQAAFLRAYDRIEQFDESRPFGPWFLRSVLNDALKAAGRQQRFVSLDGAASGDEPAAELADVLADPAPGPEALAELAEQQQAVWHALGQLAPAQRAAIVLRYYLDLSENEMAAHSGSRPGTIKWRLHSARQRLRTLLWASAPAGSATAAPIGTTREGNDE